MNKSPENKLFDYVVNPNIKEIVLTGRAGTGKTTLVSNLLFSLYNNNSKITSDRIMFSTVSNKALNVLQNSINSSINSVINKSKMRRKHFPVFELNYATITQMLNKKLKYNDKGEVVFKNASHNKFINSLYDSLDLWVIDEFSMIDDDTYKSIKSIANKHNIKLLFVGDIYQCPPPSGNSCTFWENIKHQIILDTPRRYEKNINDFSSVLIRGIDNKYSEEAIKARLTIYQNENVKVYSNKQVFVNQALDSFKNNERSIMLAYKNETVSNINKYMRNSLISTDEYGLNEFEENDVIICENSYSTLCQGRRIITSESYKVIQCKKIVHTLIVNKNKNYVLFIDNDYPFDPYKNDDSLIFSINVWDLVISPLNSVTVEQTICISLESVNDYEKFKEAAREVLCEKFDIENLGKVCNLYTKFSHGFSVNVYKSQGSTYDKVFIHGDDILNLKPLSLIDKYKSLYTAITRAAKEVHVLITK